MSYSVKWNENHPGHIVYLIDLSGSMGKVRPSDGKRMVDVVLTTIHKLFKNLDSKMVKDGKVLDRMSASVYGYNDEVITLFKGENALAINKLVIAAMRQGVLFKSQEKGDEAYPQWRTFMADAFDKAAEDIKEWIKKQEAKGIAPEKIPVPVVINITDGEPYEGDNVDAVKKALVAARKLKEIHVDDGNVLVFNIHFTADTNSQRILLPHTPPSENNCRFLFEASSVIPEILAKKAPNIFKTDDITAESRAMISNESNPVNLLAFITWGTSTGRITDAVGGIQLPGIEQAKPK